MTLNHRGLVLFVVAVILGLGWMNPIMAQQLPPKQRHLQSNIMTNDNIYTAAFQWVGNNGEALNTYGDIRYWDTSRVTNMVNLF